MTLTTVERMVLESLGNAPRGMAGLMADTRLELRFLSNILHGLTVRNLVSRGPDGYTVNRLLPDAEAAALAEPRARKEEALELLGGMLVPGQPPLRARKAWVAPKDQVVLRALLAQVGDFLDHLPPPPKEAPLHDWRVVVWGEERYGAVVDRLVREA